MEKIALHQMAATKAAATFSALGSEQRLEVLLALVRAGPEGRGAGALAERCGIPPSTLSFHLKILVQAGLVAQRRAGRQVICFAETDAIRALSGFLLAQCCAETAHPHDDHAEKDAAHG